MDWQLLIVGLAQFSCVFALVMNSKLLRDDRWVLAMTNSWFVSVTQFIFIYAVANTDAPVETFFAAALGGSIGCGCSHLFYTRWIMK